MQRGPAQGHDLASIRLAIGRPWKRAWALYDVHKLLSSDDVVAMLSALGPAGVADLSRDIDEHSENADFSFTTRPEAGYQASPLLDPKSPCRDALRQGYATAMTLVYGEQPTLEDCLQSIRASGPLL